MVQNQRVAVRNAHTEPEKFARRNVCSRRGLSVGDEFWEPELKALIRCAALIIALAAVTSAEAKGCLKGAAVGDVAGHYSGHHGLLGAAAGCAIGRHEANKRARLQNNQVDHPDRDLRNGEERL